jgi:hypothetical protein
VRSASHQTVRLSRGRHTGPAEGACVMELASMLAGEPFGDHPPCASPVVGAFLRAYNDRVDDERRQSLYGYAARVVGTRAGADVEAGRAALCRAWAEDVLADERRLRRRARRRLAIERRRVDGLTPQGAGRATGILAAMVAQAGGEGGHARALALLDRLVAYGSRGSSGETAGPSSTPPSTSKREPWHGQSQLVSAELKRSRQPRCVQRSDTACSPPSGSR